MLLLFYHYKFQNTRLFQEKQWYFCRSSPGCTRSATAWKYQGLCVNNCVVWKQKAISFVIISVFNYLFNLKLFKEPFTTGKMIAVHNVPTEPPKIWAAALTQVCLTTQWLHVNRNKLETLCCYTYTMSASPDFMWAGWFYLTAQRIFLFQLSEANLIQASTLIVFFFLQKKKLLWLRIAGVRMGAFIIHLSTKHTHTHLGS